MLSRSMAGILAFWAFGCGDAGADDKATKPNPWAGALDLRPAVTLSGPSTRVDDEKLRAAGIPPQEFVAPVQTRTEAPVYPEYSRRTGAQGLLRLECLVRTTGAVDACRIAKSVEHQLDRAAFTAIVRSKYTPAKVRGAPTAIIATFELEFRLQ
jgi:TonB family protein